jgi:hypothetical protein
MKLRMGLDIEVPVEDIIKMLDVSKIKIKDNEIKSYFTLTFQLDEELIGLEEVEEILDSIIDEFNAQYDDKFQAYKVINYNNKEFYIIYNLYFEEPEDDYYYENIYLAENQLYFEEPEDDYYYENIYLAKNQQKEEELMNPIISSINIYLIPKSPVDEKVLYDLIELSENIVNKVLEKFCIHKKRKFLYMESSQDVIKKIKNDLENDNKIYKKIYIEPIGQNKLRIRDPTDLIIEELINKITKKGITDLIIEKVVNKITKKAILELIKSWIRWSP